MSQQIPASIPSPVSPAVAAPQAAAPVADQGSTAYPQWVASTQGVPSATMPQVPSQAQLATVPSTNSQSSQYPSASSPSNPWEAALGSLDRIVSRLSPSPNQGAPSAQPQLTAADIQQLSQLSQVQPWAYQAPTAQPTSYSNESTTQTSYPTSTAQQTPSLSQETTAVVNHFGIEAPGILNQYATTLEDALIQQHQVLEEVANRGMAMETILTDPDHLADYTNRFFTEVYPVDEQQQQPTQEYRPQYDQVPAVPASATAGAPSANADVQWESFGQVMNQSPENAWRYLSQMSPEAFRSKLLFLDNA
jgi:hypothetical protein